MGKPKLAGFPNENDGDGRYYTHPLTKERLPSVTSILKLVDKSALVQWSVNLAVDYCVRNVDKLLSMSVERGINAAKYRHKDVRDERAQAGTNVHEAIEAEHTGSWDVPELDAEQLRIMDRWHEFNETHDIKPYLSEFTLWNAGISAGTADGYWEITCLHDPDTDGNYCMGKEAGPFLCLVDIKTSRNTWPEHMYQLAALWKSPVRMEEYEPDKWREVEAPVYEKVVIVHLREDLAELIEVLDLEENWEAFKAYRDAWGAKEKLKIKQRERDAKVGGF